ncbi:MAG: hypothetical protein LBM00_04090 [Deltaproteobacteria bacterium]|jgi:sarcosine oxidase gamma subunit|nr:hypothetical protein [Deltaproteobacteria bacterium]
MELAGISAITRNIWEELRQEAMRNSQKNAAASTGQELPPAGITSEDIAGDGVAALMERINAQKKRAAPAASRAAAESVTTNLENVGPNRYERIRANASSAYLAREAGYVNNANAVSALHKSA